MKAIHSACGSVKNASCLRNPRGPLRLDGQFMLDYGECIFANLTKDEEALADRMATAWTNFATHG